MPEKITDLNIDELRALAYNNIVTSLQVAQYHGLSKRYIQSLCKTGIIRATKVNSDWHITIEDAMSFHRRKVGRPSMRKKAGQ